MNRLALVASEVALRDVDVSVPASGRLVESLHAGWVDFDELRPGDETSLSATTARARANLAT